MYGYYREKFLVNHFWELRVHAIIFDTSYSKLIITIRFTFTIKKNLNQTNSSTLVTCHVNQLHCHSCSIQSSFHHTLRRTDKCVNSPVCGHAWIHVKKWTTINRSNSLCYGVDHLFVSSFGEIWNTFNDTSHNFFVYNTCVDVDED